MGVAGACQVLGRRCELHGDHGFLHQFAGQGAYDMYPQYAIAVRIGTIMPGLLPLIKVGSESELGRAVSQLTGLSALVDLADHVRRAKAKIDKEFVKSKTGERDRADRNYGTAKDDLEKILLACPARSFAADLWAI